MSPVQLEVSWNQREFFPSFSPWLFASWGVKYPVTLVCVSKHLSQWLCCRRCDRGVSWALLLTRWFTVVIDCLPALWGTGSRGTRGGDRMWHYFWAKNWYSSLCSFVVMSQLQSPDAAPAWRREREKSPSCWLWWHLPREFLQLSFEGHFGAYEGLKIDTTFPQQIKFLTSYSRTDQYSKCSQMF